MVAPSRSHPRSRPDQAAADCLAELLEKHPELRAHTLPASAGDIAEAVHMAALDDLLDAIELAAQRPDVIAVMRERNSTGENHVRRTFGEGPVAPDTGPLTHLTLKVGLPQ